MTLHVKGRGVVPKISIPSWWLSVGPDTAFRLEDLFAAVMAELPMPQKELATKLDVTPVTLWRWAERKTTPQPETMLKAVKQVRDELHEQLDRASIAVEAFQHLVAAEEAADAAGRSVAGWPEAAPIGELLDLLGVEVPDPQPDG